MHQNAVVYWPWSSLYQCCINHPATHYITLTFTQQQYWNLDIKVLFITCQAALQFIL